MSRTTPGRGHQIPLPFSRFEPLDFDLYLTGENREVQTVLERTATGGQQRFVYLWGEHGSGKSHLLQATCKSAAAAGLPVAYLPMREFRRQPVTILEGLGEMRLICVDDIDLIAGIPAWEEALFHLYNHLKDNSAIMLMSAQQGPAALGIHLEDLKSRLGWGLVYQLTPLSDTDKVSLLKRRALARGFTLPDEVADYLMTHARRDLKSLLGVLDRIDQASLAEHRRITVPFVKQLLSISPGGSD